jgi:hypothetical protein
MLWKDRFLSPGRWGCATLAAVFMALAPMATPVALADTENPDWPCVWRKFVTLDAATIWDGPAIEEAGNWRNDNDIRQLSQYLILRRIPLEEIEAEIKKFAEGLPEDSRDQKLTQLFAGVLDRTNEERRIVVGGIERFHKRQLARAEAIEKKGITLPALGDALQDEPIVATEVDQLSPEEEAFNWEVRVFMERQRNIPLACEIPQLMDERAGAIARAIRAEMKE